LLTPFAGVAEGVANAIAESIGGITSIIAPLGDLVTPLLDGVGGAFTEFGKTVGLVADIIGKTLGVVLTPLTQLFSALGSPIDIVTLALQGVNAALELMTNAIDGAISSWNGFVSQIPLVGQYMTIATQEAQAGLGDVKAAAEAGLEVEPPESFASFEQAIGKARETLNGAIEEASQFGQAGFDAAFQFQEALAELQRQAEAGILNETAYEQEVQKATEEERKAEAARQAAEAAIQADQQRADAAIERLRVDQQFGGDSGRAEAAENVLAIEREQIRVEEELRAAREAGDQAAADAAAARLAQLDQVEARERDIASGAAKAREEADKKAKQAADERARAEEQKRKQIADLEERYQERFTEIQRERLDSLSRQSNQALAGNDIRTSAGAAQFLSLATGREDPAVDEYRKQLRELQDIKREIAKANAAPVEIAG
jgi:colicin import membrane protein